MVSRLRQVPPPLALLLAVGALLAAPWALVLPPLQGPDESTHVSAVTSLVEHGELSTDLPRELGVLERDGGFGALIGNLAARAPSGEIAERRLDDALDALGDARADPEPDVEGPAVRGVAYTLWDAPAYAVAREASLLDRLTVLRLWNIPLLLVTIAACWVFVAEVLPGLVLARVLAAGLAALQPQLVFLAGVVNPDTLLVACSSVFFAAAAALLRRGFGRGRALVVLGAAVLATATHARGGVLVPCAVLALLLAVPWRTLTAQARRRALVSLGAAILVVAAACGAIALVLDLSLTEGAEGQDASAAQLVSYVWQFYLPGLPWMDAPLGGDYGIREVGLETAWGAFANLEVRYASWTYDLLAAALVLVAVGAAAAVWRGRVRLEAGRRLALLTAVVVLAVLAVLHVSAYRLLLVEPTDPIIVGRHLLVLVAPLGLLLGMAVAGLGRRAAPVAASVVLGLLAALHLAGLGLTVSRFYG